METTIVNSLDDLVIDKIKVLEASDAWTLSCGVQIDGYKLIINIIKPESKIV